MSKLPCCRGNKSFIVLPLLTPDELSFIQAKTAEKMGYVRRKGRRQQFQPKGMDRDQYNFEANCAEAAWSWYRGMGWGDRLYREGAFTPFTDLPDGSEVRHTKYQNGHLGIRKPGHGFALDDPDSIYNLVTGDPPQMTWRGWIMGRDGQLPEHWMSTGPGHVKPGYFIPQRSLHGWPYHGPATGQQGLFDARPEQSPGETPSEDPEPAPIPDWLKGI